MAIQYERTKELVLAQMLEGLNQTIGSASLLIHHHQDVRWMQYRERIEMLKNLIINTSVNPLMRKTMNPNGRGFQ